MTWVIFDTVRENLDFAEVLAHFQFQTKPNGQDQVKIHCPFHDDSNPSCSVNLKRKIWKCWSCKAKGNVLDFFARMEGFDPDTPRELRDAALLAVETFGIDGGTRETKSGNQPKVKAKPAKRQKPPAGSAKVPKKRAASPKAKAPHSEPSAASERPVNTPLTFELQLDANHPYLAERGLTKRQIAEFGLGYAKRGSMKGRICFPVHNVDGELIAYSGRWVGDDLPDDTPRYLLPKGFEKSLVLYNLHRVLAEGVPETVVIVEGFWSVLRLHAAGVPVISTFGASVSDAQADLLVAAGVTSCILIFDGDEGGRTGAEQALPVLAERLFVRNISLEDGVMPDTMGDDILDGLPRR